MKPTDPSASGQDTVPGMPGVRGWTYTPGDGVWRSGQQILNQCPVVTSDNITWNDNGTRITERWLTITVRGSWTEAEDREIRSGKVWNRLLLPGSAGMTNVLAEIIFDQASRLHDNDNWGRPQ